MLLDIMAPETADSGFNQDLSMTQKNPSVVKRGAKGWATNILNYGLS